MVFVCHEKQFPGVSRGLTHGEANDKCITGVCSSWFGLRKSVLKSTYSMMIFR